MSWGKVVRSSSNSTSASVYNIGSGPGERSKSGGQDMPDRPFRVPLLVCPIITSKSSRVWLRLVTGLLLLSKVMLWVGRPTADHNEQAAVRLD